MFTKSKLQYIFDICFSKQPVKLLPPKHSISTVNKERIVVQSQPTDLRVKVIGWLLLCQGRDWLLWGFTLLWVPSSSGRDCGWAINYSTAIGMNKRLA